MQRIYGHTLKEIMFKYLVETGEKNTPLEEAFLSTQMLGGIKKTAYLLDKLHSNRLVLLDTTERSLYWHTKNCRYLTDGEKSIVCKMIDTLLKESCVCHRDSNTVNIIDDGKYTYSLIG